MALSDLWHYPRKQLSQQVLTLFESGLSHVLIFFAPRRMGKTEFLRKDIELNAQEKGWNAIYFSFLDVGENPHRKFVFALNESLAKRNVARKAGSFLKHVKKLSGSAAGLKAEVEVNKIDERSDDLKVILGTLSKKNKVILLLDEIQVLASRPIHHQFIASLRTALDIHKDRVKVIFTGSSREGLRQMFSKSDAPFFHFGLNIPFPEFGREFTDHLAEVFYTITKRKLNSDELWHCFESMQKIPQLTRALVESLILKPDLTLLEAKDHLLNDVVEDRTFADRWSSSSILEQRILLEIATGSDSAFFSEESRQKWATQFGVSQLPVSSVQSAIRSLQRKGLIGRKPSRGEYFIDDPTFKNWVIQNQ